MKVFRVRPVGLAIPRRAFHSSQNRLRETFTIHKDDPWQKRFMPTRQAVIHVPDPTKTTISSIVSRLGNLRVNEHVWNKRFHPAQHAIIILATPSFASYLEQESGFIPLLLQAINLPSASKTSSLKVDVVCGCVDGLPPAVDFIPQARGQPVQEGFSILYGETSDIFPRYVREKEVKTEGKSEKPGSVIFRRPEKRGLEITLPLANTLFKNGRLSTLLASRWEATDNGYKQIESQTNIDSISLNALGREYEVLPEFYIPAIPLTYARELQNGFGNIIRSLQFVGPDGSKFHPASSELEIKVPRFLKEALGKMAALKIWALIIPQPVALKAIEESSSTLRLPNKAFKEMQPIEDYREIGHWISQGARLCRVQSGGGGWGPKAGLLSLDPECTYSSTPETSLIMDDTFMDENKLPGLDNIAKNGSYIQFFTARETRTARKRHSKHKSQNTARQATIIGTIPSSIDSQNREQNEEERTKHLDDLKALEITAAESDSLHRKAVQLLEVPFLRPGSPLEQVEAKLPDIPPMKKDDDDGFRKDGFYMKSLMSSQREMYFRKGDFGFVSESGMFIKQSGVGNKNHFDGKIKTKIDIPYSFVCKTFGEPVFEIKRFFS